MSQPDEPVEPKAPVEGAPAESAPAVDATPPEAVETYADAPSGDEEPFVRRRRRGGGDTKMPGEDVTHLNLTPMMDIMTILLVFLVMSFATDPGNINVTLDLHPPESSATQEMKAATSVTLTANTILVGDAEVMSLSTYKHEQGKPIPEVLKALDKERERLKHLEELGGSPFDGSLLVIAHETTPYELVADVLQSAGLAQYSKYELVVMKAGSAPAN